MGKKLVIVESPAKAKTIGKILGKDFVVKSSMGHIRDLPVRTLGVDVEHGFAPKYVLVKGRKRMVDELKKAAEGCDAVYLAPDPDREGEAIAWHLQKILEESKHTLTFHRVQYNEITPRAVRAAFEHPGEIDTQRVDAQQARRVLDRLVGYTVSPMLWRRIKRGLSAGRVQSVALRLVCERETEIRSFVPEAFWVMGARVRKLIVPLTPFAIRLMRIGGEKANVRSEEQATAIKSDLEGRSLRVAKVERKEVTKRAAPPFITSTLQQAASSACGYSPKRTMSLAQKLYEGINLGEGATGLITYMRTDSVSIARDAQDACRTFIEGKFGPDYRPEKPNVYRSRSGAQEAHEAIRPTDVTRTPDSLKGRLDADGLRLYGLIWRRFVASQMSPARIEQCVAKVAAEPTADRPTPYTFHANSSHVKFPGYMKVMGVDRKSTKEGEEPVPELTEGEPLICIEWLSERKETQPPPRYSETSLVGALEKNGIGRPSTYAQIISTLQDRHYVLREKRMLSPTELGEQVNTLLVETLDELFNVTFTAAMEKQLDEIEGGRVEWTGMLGDFYGKFKVWMEATREPAADATLVQRFLDLLGRVETWAPPVKRGRRTYSDERFVESVGKQFADGEKPISQRQLETLMRMGARYREQVPEVETLIREQDRMDLFESRDVQPPRETTLRKVEIVKTLELDESTQKFVDSLVSQVEGNRRLSDAQLKALDRVILARSEAVPDFEARKEELGLDKVEDTEDALSRVLLEAMGHVGEWKPPTKRGRRTFDDKAFYESLSGHYETKRFLSVRQRGALARMVTRYREQIPNYEELAKVHGLGRKQSKPGADDKGD